jgi:geranylgeranyl reductase family protein
MIDALIIGGGPAGSKAASLLAAEHEVLVIEKRNADGRPVHCTGLISQETLKLSSVRPKVLNTLYGAEIIFPNGKKITINSDEEKALLIDRNELDSLMAEKAKNDGAVFAYSERYVSHTVTNNKVVVRTDKREIETRILVGADGHGSATASTIQNNGPKEFVKGFQADVSQTADDQKVLTIRVGSRIAPGFFSWEIPFGDMSRIGLCVSADSGTPYGHFRNLLRTAGISDDNVKRTYCGRIPLGGRGRTYADNLLLIGDAAGQVKPISGGGLQPAFKAAYALAETVNEALENNDLSEKFLSIYEKRWKRDIGKEMKRGYRLRKMFLSMDDDELNRMSEIADRENIKKILTAGDIDHPSDLLLPLMKDPVTALKLIPFMAKAGIRSMTPDTAGKRER